MKILAIYNNDFNANDYKLFSLAIDNLRRQGHNIVKDSDFRSLLKKDSKDSYDKFQKKLEKAIRDTDIVITDVTKADVKVGFDIASAISEKKIVIVLHQNEKGNLDIIPIQGSNAKQLIVRNYNSKNIIDVVNSSIEEAKSKLDTKFILIISPEIDRYLDWASQTKRMHKAQIVRNSIENSLKKDREYRVYLQG